MQLYRNLEPPIENVQLPKVMQIYRNLDPPIENIQLPKEMQIYRNLEPPIEDTQTSKEMQMYTLPSDNISNFLNVKIEEEIIESEFLSENEHENDIFNSCLAYSSTACQFNSVIDNEEPSNTFVCNMFVFNGISDVQIQTDLNYQNDLVDRKIRNNNEN